MLSFAAVVLDVVSDLAPCESMVSILGHFEFGLDGSKARFHEGIVVAVIGSVHTLPHASAS